MSNEYTFWIFWGAVLLFVGLLVWMRSRRYRKSRFRSKWWNEYHAFLNSEHWRCIRYQKLCEARFQCQIEGCRNKVLQVHHLSYRNYWEGDLRDLVVLCHEHHQAVHGRAF